MMLFIWINLINLNGSPEEEWRFLKKIKLRLHLKLLGESSISEV